MRVLIVAGVAVGSPYASASECDTAASIMAGNQYAAITQWAGGKAVRKDGDDWIVRLDGQVIFRATCRAQ